MGWSSVRDRLTTLSLYVLHDSPRLADLQLRRPPPPDGPPRRPPPHDRLFGPVPLIFTRLAVFQISSVSLYFALVGLDVVNFLFEGLQFAVAEP